MFAHLPPLDHLRVFEAAARHLSFQAAAAELHVTPAAVSQRIRALEALLDVKLFRRLTRQILLTQDGQMLMVKMRDALALIAEGVVALDRSSSRGALTISTTNTFAEQYLLPRLGGFRTEYPDHNVRVLVSDDLVALETDAVDLVVRQGRGPYPGYTAAPLFKHDHYIVVCAPDLAVPRLLQSALWAKATLIHVEWPARMAGIPSWAAWFKRHNFNPPQAASHMHVPFEALAIRAAVRGQGFALAHHALVAEELAIGALVTPFGRDKNLRQNYRYRLLHLAAVKNESAKLFSAWLLRQNGSGLD